jgi:hypothetical protein
MKKSILIIGLGLYAMGVVAESAWFPITTKSNSGTQMLIDADNIKIFGDFTTAWIKRTTTDGYYNIYSFQSLNAALSGVFA